MRTFPVVALLLVLALAGCADGDDTPLHDDLQVEAAKALGDDTALYAIVGIEPQQEMGSEECGSFKADASPGDGRPSAWGHLYGSAATGEALVVVSDPAGNVLCEESEELDEGLVPLTDWNLDSVAAAKVLADHVPEYPEKVAGANVFFMLADGGEGPVWAFGVVTDQEEVLAWAVDAMTGEVLEDVPDLTGGGSMVEQGSISGTTIGTLLVTTYSSEPFSIQQGHAALELMVEFADPTAEVLDYTVRVVGPGETTDHTASNGDVIRIDGPAGGEYTVFVFPATAGAWDYTVAYCASTDDICGEPADGMLRFWA